MIAKRQAAALPHTGIATFCKAPYVFEPAEMNADVAVLGIPFDNTRFGWLGDDAGSSGYFDIGQNATLLSGVRIVDAGGALAAPDGNLVAWKPCGLRRWRREGDRGR